MAMKVYVQNTGVDLDGCFVQYALYDAASDPTQPSPPPPVAGPFVYHLPPGAATPAQIRAAVVGDAQVRAQAYVQAQAQQAQAGIVNQVIGTVVATV